MTLSPQHEIRWSEFEFLQMGNHRCGDRTALRISKYDFLCPISNGCVIFYCFYEVDFTGEYLPAQDYYKTISSILIITQALSNLRKILRADFI